MTVAIHQPDFMPWLGFFLKMKKSDKLIVLDHTENNPRDAASWLRRVRIAVQNEPQWLSIPIQKIEGKVGVPINEMRLSAQTTFDFAEKNLKIIRHSYSKTPQYATVFPIVEAYFSMSTDSVCERNMFFIETVKEKLGIQTQLIYSSKRDPQYKSTAMLIDLLQKTDATTYLCGDGAAGYMELDLFEKAQIAIKYNRFAPPQYPQVNTKEFIGGLSIVDVLMNIGFDGTAELLQNLTEEEA